MATGVLVTDRSSLSSRSMSAASIGRPAEVVALADVAAHPAQGQELGGVLDPSATVTSRRLSAANRRLIRPAAASGTAAR